MYYLFNLGECDVFDPILRGITAADACLRYILTISYFHVTWSNWNQSKSK